MKAIVFDNKLSFVENHPKPQPLENEALIRVSMAGICNTDIEILRGYSGFRGILGHEFIGTVEALNSNNQDLLSRRVVGEINLGCGNCEYCLRGMKNHCPHRKVLGIVNKDGAMAEYLTLPLENLFPVPDGVSDEEAVFAEPLAAAFEITGQLHIRPDEEILVMGDGKLGLLISFVLNLYSPHLTLAGKHEGKLKLAEKKGIKTFLVNALPGGKKYDVVVDATGRAGGFEMALGFLKPKGVLVLKSTVAEGRKMNLAPLVIGEITVIGSRCGPFVPALHALSEKFFEVRPLITGVFPFSSAKEAFEKTSEKNSLKVIIDFRA